MAKHLSPGGLLSYFTRHGTAANLLLVILIVLGLAALPRMRAQFFPDIVIDNVSVSVKWSGAGAEDVDAAIVQVLEPALLAVEGVESSRATSSEGSARITLDFDPGWDMARATDDVQVAVDAISTLPDEAEEPNVRRGAWRDRVTDVVITGPVAPGQLGRFADEFVIRLFAAGVTRATIRGVAAPETLVEVPMSALIRNDITMRAIADAIAGEAESDPAGDVAGGTSRVRTGVAKRSADQISAIVLRSNDDGSKLLIGDVARVTVGDIDRERAAALVLLEPFAFMPWFFSIFLSSSFLSSCTLSWSINLFPWFIFSVSSLLITLLVFTSARKERMLSSITFPGPSLNSR